VSAAARTALAEALQRDYPDSAGFVRDPQTVLTLYELPLLGDATIYRVYAYGAHHPIAFMVGLAGGVAFPLTGKPDNFSALARAAAVAIETAAAARDYACAWLVTTRPPGRRFVIVAALDDIEFLPNPDAEDRARIAAFKREFGARLAPPIAVATNDAFRVTLYAVRERALELHMLTVRPDGSIDDVIETLTDTAPVLEGG
jgi:hypothetical protein